MKGKHVLSQWQSAALAVFVCQCPHGRLGDFCFGSLKEFELDEVLLSHPFEITVNVKL